MISHFLNMKERRLTDEILDSLPSDDPEALRSRHDLKFINFLMRNPNWIRACHKKFEEIDRVTELGAGDGSLLNSIYEEGYEVSGIDLQPKPKGLSSEIQWIQGNVCHQDPSEFSHTNIAVLFLHHLNESQLKVLGEKLRGGKFLFIVEPHRSLLSILQAYILIPFVNRVTRHDMIVSIKAGFKKGELPFLLGLDTDVNWSYSEQITLLGSYRLSARRIK